MLVGSILEVSAGFEILPEKSKLRVSLVSRSRPFLIIMLAFVACAGLRSYPFPEHLA
jgi:hypothetical protein